MWDQNFPPSLVVVYNYILLYEWCISVILYNNNISLTSYLGSIYKPARPGQGADKWWWSNILCFRNSVTRWCVANIIFVLKQKQSFVFFTITWDYQKLYNAPAILKKTKSQIKRFLQYPLKYQYDQHTSWS